MHRHPPSLSIVPISHSHLRVLLQLVFFIILSLHAGSFFFPPSFLFFSLLIHAFSFSLFLNLSRFCKNHKNCVFKKRWVMYCVWDYSAQDSILWCASVNIIPYKMHNFLSRGIIMLKTAYWGVLL